MRILIDRGSDPAVAGGAINARIADVRIAIALLRGAASAAESEIATAFATGPTPVAIVAADSLFQIIKSCRAFEAAVDRKG
jgi:hypothetical protein